MDGLDNRKISWPIAGNRAGAPSWKRNFPSRGLPLGGRRGKFAARNLGRRGGDRTERKKTRRKRDTEKEKGKGLRRNVRR